MKTLITSVLILLCVYPTFSQKKVDFESIAFQFFLDSMDAFLDSKDNQKIYYNSYTQFEQLNVFYFQLTQYPVSESDRNMLDREFKERSDTLFELGYMAEKKFPYDVDESKKEEDTIILCSTDTILAYSFKAPRSIHRKRSQYIRENYPYKMEKYVSKTIHVEENEKLTEKIEDYKRNKLASVMEYTSRHIDPEGLNIVHIVVMGTPRKDIYVFMDNNGNILRHYKFDYCQRKRYNK